MDPDFKVGYLYEFVVEFSNNLHTNIFVIRGSKIKPIFMFDFSVFPKAFRMGTQKWTSNFHEP